MLTEDEREQRGANRVGLSAEPPVAILAAIQIVRREDDEAAIGERRPEIVVERHVPIDRLARQPVAAVLDHDHRTPFARGDALGNDDDAPGEHVGPDVEHDVPGRPSVRLTDLACPRIERDVGRVERTDAVLAKALAIGARAFDELVCRPCRPRLLGIPFQRRQFGQDGKEKRLVANMLGPSHQCLDVALHFEHCPGVAGRRIESLPAVGERAARTRREREAQAPGEIAERFPRYRGDRTIAVAGHERRFGERRNHRNAIELGANRCSGWRLPCPFAAGE